MHTRAMHLLKKQLSSSVIEYVPIAMIATENMAFTKMKIICELEERHRVRLGAGYKNKTLCRAQDPRANGAWLNKLT